MKKSLLILLLLIVIPFLTGCTASVVGKFDNYNEIFNGTIDLDMQGHGKINVTSYPNNLACNGKGWITYIPATSYIFGTCKGQKGEAILTCDDGRVIQGEWTCKSCTRIFGTAMSNKNEAISFFITPKKKQANELLDKYKQEVSDKPFLYNRGITKSIDSLF